MTALSRTAAFLALCSLLPASQAPVASFTATAANVAGAPDAIRIEVLRWSTGEERAALMSAWNLTGGAGRGASAGRGGRGILGPPPPPPTPQGMLEAALQKVSTVGYLWSSEVAGYALRYAGRVQGPNGAERIVLITGRRLGHTNTLWNPVPPGTAANYDFSVIELRVDAKGHGEGRISLTGKVAPDSAAGIVTLENYNAAPVVLKNLKRQAVSSPDRSEQ